jgi:hypothetical protein
MLRIVHPPGTGNNTDPPKRRGYRAPALFLNDTEVHNLRIAIRNTARAHGGFAKLAKAIGMRMDTLHSVTRHKRPSATIALRVAQAAGMAVEVLLSGKLTEAGCCPTCGSRIGERVVVGGRHA